MATNLQDLIDIQANIEKKKTQIAELKGQKKQQLKTLKEDWNCSTIEEAEQKVQKAKKEVDQLEIEVQDKLEELQEKYPMLF